MCVLFAGVDSFAELNGAELLPHEDVVFLQPIADCDGLLPERCAAVLTDCVEPKPAKAARIEQPEVLLSLPSTSDINIKGCGPRDAGQLFLKALRSSGDRHPYLWRAWGRTCLCLCCVLQEQYARRCTAASNYWELSQVAQECEKWFAFLALVCSSRVG